jgi:hypothetical protein
MSNHFKDKPATTQTKWCALHGAYHVPIEVAEVVLRPDCDPSIEEFEPVPEVALEPDYRPELIGPVVSSVVEYDESTTFVLPRPEFEGHLPTDAARRKALPIATGVIDYFPDAIVAIAELSRLGNDQHNPGAPLHWDRSKSTDEGDALMRHFVERGTVDTDGARHSAKVAWRALAGLQKEIEKSRGEK